MYGRDTVEHMLRYWHPVLGSARLRPGCVIPIRIASLPIAVFRTAAGNLGAVDDQCAHRRMKLSEGRVEEERLICPYHGWSYRVDGHGQSPGTPRLQACVNSYECAEAAGAIWIKRRASDHVLDAPAAAEMRPTGVVFCTVRAPLELVVDNFSEIEHTVAMHPDFGFDRHRADEATVTLETSDQSVTIRSKGPAKMPPLDTRITGGIRRGDRFHSDFTFRFDPPQSNVRHFWIDSGKERPRLLEYRLVHYFVPVDATTTSIVTFGFLEIRRTLFSLFSGPVAWMFRRKLHRTVAEDARIVENLADLSTAVEGMKLGRFDAILGMTRERLARIYYGATPD